jgi:hypothetical protein
VRRNREEAIAQKLGSAARLFSGREKWSQLMMLLQRHRVSAHGAQRNLRRRISNSVDERQPKETGFPAGNGANCTKMRRSVDPGEQLARPRVTSLDFALIHPKCGLQNCQGSEANCPRRARRLVDHLAELQRGKSCGHSI